MAPQPAPAPTQRALSASERGARIAAEINRVAMVARGEIASDATDIPAASGQAAKAPKLATKDMLIAQMRAAYDAGIGRRN